MTKKTIQMPKQQRSIEKRQKIMEVGYQLICEKGFHRTNTAEIAKAAGISSGIIYRYFKDKKDIFMSALKEISGPSFDQLFDILDKIETQAELRQFIAPMVWEAVDSHLVHISPSAINETLALALSDADFSQLLAGYRRRTCQKLVDTMKRIGYAEQNLEECAYMIYYLVDHLADDSILLQQQNLDITFIVNQTIAMIEQLLNNQGALSD